MAERISTVQERRAMLIDIALRHAKKGTGSSKEFLMKRTTKRKWTDLTPILKPIKWAVVGGVATRLYAPERATFDLDIVISSQDGNTVREKMCETGFRFQREIDIGRSSWRSQRGKSIDILELNTPWIEDALFEAQTNRDKQGLPILPFPFLVLIKFQASRLIDFGDLSRMLGFADDKLIQLTKAVFRQYEPTSMKDLENIIYLGKLELQ